MHVELGPDGIGDPIAYGRQVSDQAEAYKRYGPPMTRGAARRAARIWARIDRQANPRLLPQGKLSGAIGKQIRRTIIEDRRRRREVRP